MSYDPNPATLAVQNLICWVTSPIRIVGVSPLVPTWGWHQSILIWFCLDGGSQYLRFKGSLIMPKIYDDFPFPRRKNIAKYFFNKITQ